MTEQMADVRMSSCVTGPSQSTKADPLLVTCALIPAASFCMFYSFVLRARFALGVWPVPYRPDPKSLGLEMHHEAVWVLLEAAFVSPIAFALCAGPRVAKVMKQSLLAAVLAWPVACTDTVSIDVTPEDHRAVMQAVLHHVGVLGGTELPLFKSERVLMEWLEDERDDWNEVVDLRPGVLSSLLAANPRGACHGSWLGAWGVGLIDRESYWAHAPEGWPRMSAEGWESVARGPPRCTVLVSLSAPGFSEDGCQAMISVGGFSGSWSGHTELYLLERWNGSWVVIMALVTEES